MRRISKRIQLLSSALLVLGLTSVAIVTSQDVWADSEVPGSGERIVVIHDGGSKKGILTKAITVRQAIEDAEIALDGNDLVEPRLDAELVASSYDINIYRARPITVVDGSVRKKIMSAYRTPRQIAEHADIQLRNEDLTEMKLAVGVNAGIELIITRAKPVNLVLYGKKIVAYTQASTVAELLEEKEVTLGKDDTLSVSPETPVSPGIKVEIWREGKQTITEEEAVDFPIEQIQDADREVGFKEIRTPGVPGKKSVTYEVEMKNGKEVSRKEIQSIAILQPKKQVEVVGVKTRIMPYTGGGNMTEWLTEAGIAKSDWGYVQYIADRESGGNPNATNPSSGACGLIQAHPCDKVPGNPYNPVDNLRWANGYAEGRYGGWGNAYNFWVANNWW